MTQLIEYKLRRYIHLGNKISAYIPSALRKRKFEENEEIIGIQIIEKMVNKNNIDLINSIVPILLKIKQGTQLQDDRHLIFLLAVCTRFNVELCEKMVSDAYAAVLPICTNGLKFLMFVKFCEIASDMMYNIPLEFDDGFKNALKNWYLNNPPFIITHNVVYYKQYCGWTHLKLMKKINLKSDNINQQLFILHTFFGMNKVKKEFQNKFNDVQTLNENNTIEHKEFKSIYIFLKQLDVLKNMNKKQLIKEIELNRWRYEAIPQQMILNKEVVIVLIKRMPLRMVLENTFFFSKHKIFHNNKIYNGVSAYILRFNDTLELKESQIHPIESFIQYAKYTRTSLNIARMQKKEKTIFNKPLNINKKLLVQMKKKKSKELRRLGFKTKKNYRYKSNKNHKKVIKKKYPTTPAYTPAITSATTSATTPKLVPAPKLVKELVTFLSDDLIKLTLKVLKPYSARIIIAFDCRVHMRLKQCECNNLISVHEATTLIILSLIYPNKYNNKPTLRGLNETHLMNINQMKIDYTKHLTFSSVESALFKSLPSHIEDLPDNHKTHLIHPLTTVEWAKENKKKYDVFIFLGTTQMKFSNINKTIKDYQESMNISSKFIICSLNGRHPQQRNLSRDKMLFITGFDKNVGRLINSFINNEF